MRIVMIGLFGLKPKGTMSVRALPMAQALVAKGHQVDVIMPPWSYPQDSGREWEENGVSIHNITLPTRFPLLWHLIITWRLVRRALALRPDVVHCFKPKGYAGLAALVFWLLKELGLSQARLVVDSDDWEGKGGWNEIEPYTWLQRRFFAWQEWWGLTHCDALTVASRALETIVWSLGVEPGQVFYVPNGVVSGFEFRVSSSEFNTQYPISNTQFLQKGMHPTVLLYTRFFEFAVERIVGIFQRVLAGIPEARLLVVGKGFFGEEERLRELMREAGIADHLVYVDWVEPDELPAYFAAADVAVYPYDDVLINRTKCAVKLVDLMVAGLPVVADDVGQNGEYVVHGASGLLVPIGETDAFAGSVVELLRDESLRAKLGRGAQRRILEEFNWGKLVERVEEAYGGKPRYDDGGRPRYDDGGRPRYDNGGRPRYDNGGRPRYDGRKTSRRGRGQMTRSSLAAALVTRYLRYWLPVLLWMGMIFVASSRSSLPFVLNKTVDFATKKAGHVTEYGVLAFLLWRAISKEREWLALPSFGGAFVLSLLYAVSDELHQTFVPGRNGALADVGFDALGALLALGLVWWFSDQRWAKVSDRAPAASVRDRGGGLPARSKGAK